MLLKLESRNTLNSCARTRCWVLGQDGTVLKPDRIYRSRTGAHGEDCYVIAPPVWVIEYRMSNSGREYLTVREVRGEEDEVILHLPFPEPVRRFLDEVYPKWVHFEIEEW